VNGRLSCNGGNWYGGRDNHGNRYGTHRDRNHNRVSQTLPSGSYQQSCIDESMNGSVLTGSCTSWSGQRITSSLDVNRCTQMNADIGNVNGNLRCVRSR